MGFSRALTCAAVCAVTTACGAVIGLEGLHKDDCATCSDGADGRSLSTPGGDASVADGGSETIPRLDDAEVDDDDGFIPARPDVCVPEDAAAFCSRLGRNCGTLSAPDNCGAPRADVDCGVCTAPHTCGGGGTANVCGGGGAPSLFNGQVVTSMDDVEEKVSDGDIYEDSSDLELTYDGYVHDNQIVGVRFNNVTVPKNATIMTAYLQFTAQEDSANQLLLTIFGEASDNAPPFTKAAFNVSTRPKTSAVTWSSVPAWGAANEATANERTPDLKVIVQEIVNRPNWAVAGSMVFIVTSPTTTEARAAWAYDGKASGAVRLHIEYQ